MKLFQSNIYFLLIELAFFGQPDISAYLLKKLYAAQFIFKIIDRRTQRRLGNTQSCSRDRIMFHLSENRKIAKIVVVHNVPRIIFPN